MRNFFILLIIAIVAITVLLFLFNPEILSDIWLWLIGLAGPIVALVRKGADSVSNLFQRSETNKALADTRALDAEKARYELKIRKLEQEIGRLHRLVKIQNEKDNFQGTTLSVLRYIDDGETTLGLLYLQDDFFCYTLEDAFQEVKIPGKTRIPAGTYELDFYTVETDLTRTYRERFNWFDWHLKIKDIPNFTNVYIHCGNDHTHTEGCLLVAQNISATDAHKRILNSRKTYEILYKSIKELKAQGQPVRIKLFDEHWFKSVDLKHRYVNV